MYDTHIAHSISTFSEIGIVASVAMLFEVIPLQKKIKSDLLIAIESQRVTQADYHEKANGFPLWVSKIIHFILIFQDFLLKSFIKILLIIIKILPAISIVLGAWALFGIAFYPPVLSSMSLFTQYISFERKEIDAVYFTMSLVSAMSVFTPIITKWTQDLINWYALKDVKIE
ncbi:MAG: hypothetical protein HFP81_01935 [Methylococcales symbiont of Hymedesmia sp. n. MRB-2018]|nr:MAG: hypothetical protein HFP78_03600 [Methylococcales symbiont of Hymedesmia sp. n. MRB-2018]KAF3984478.1 MAG: hypothetical protein HFP81_01935 [Methylococcales symbiont of Hymedesmia sp. n. MRB-2018]